MNRRFGYEGYASFRWLVTPMRAPRPITAMMITTGHTDGGRSRAG